MKEIPILFSTPMVAAILDGSKTMTRRIIKWEDQPSFLYKESFIDFSKSFGWVVKHPIGSRPVRYEVTQNFKCPYGQVGDILWVRETWRGIEQDFGNPRYEYKATEKINLIEKWKPSIFMPKEACRIFLKIISVRVERLHDITEADAKAEGVESCIASKEKFGCRAQGLLLFRDYSRNDNSLVDYPCGGFDNAIDSFNSLWTKINGQESWDANPFVWVVEFERCEKPEMK